MAGQSGPFRFGEGVNEKYVWPKVVISRNSDVMRELERRHGKDLPVVRGDYTPYWEDGCASTSEATSLCRIGCERMVQAQALFAMLRPGAFPAGAFDAAWTDLIMYDEHTWGAHCSISQPDDPFTIHQDEYKQAYARRGHRAAAELVELAVEENAVAEPLAIDVFNTASWDRARLWQSMLPRLRTRCPSATPPDRLCRCSVWPMEGSRFVRRECRPLGQHGSRWQRTSFRRRDRLVRCEDVDHRQRPGRSQDRP